MALMTAVCQSPIHYSKFSGEFYIFYFQSCFSGRMFDKDGNIRQWWTNRTIEEYVNRTECFIKQYNSYYLPEIDRYVSYTK